MQTILVYIGFFVELRVGHILQIFDTVQATSILFKQLFAKFNST